MSYISGPGAGEAVTLGRTGVVERNPIVIQKVSGQSGPLLQCIDVDGVTVLAQIGADGSISGGSSLAGAVILAPATAGRNTIQPTANNVDVLTIKPHTTSQSVPLINIDTTGGNGNADIQCFDGGGIYFNVGNPRFNDILDISARRISDGGLPFTVESFQGTANPLSTWSVTDPTNVFHSAQWRISKTGNPEWYLADSTNVLSEVGSVVGAFSSNTHGATKGRMIANAVDSNATRECIRWEADGANPRIGFLGAAAVVQQAGASAAGIGSVIDANAKAALTALQAALAAYGLVTSPA